MTGNNYIRIFDTTLRDGEQSPGATMSSTEKVKVAQALARLGVDVIEAGFPAASPDDLEAVRKIATEVGNLEGEIPPPIICGLARASRGDIDKKGGNQLLNFRSYLFLGKVRSQQADAAINVKTDASG